MMSFKRSLVLAAITAPILLSAPAIAHCNPRNSEQSSDCHAQQAKACSYSARERYLAEAIAQLIAIYYQRTGQVLPVTAQTVLQVMQIIGASDSEAAFVVDLIVAKTRAISLLASCY